MLVFGMSENLEFRTRKKEKDDYVRDEKEFCIWGIMKVYTKTKRQLGNGGMRNRKRQGEFDAWAARRTEMLIFGIREKLRAE